MYTGCIYGIIAIGVLELLLVDRSQQQQFPLLLIERQPMIPFYKEHSEDTRILNTKRSSNFAQITEKYDVWGYDPVVLRRYAEYIAFTQKSDHVPYGSGDEPVFTNLHPLFNLVRCSFALLKGETEPKVVKAPTPPLPHALLLYDYTVAEEPELTAQEWADSPVLAAMNDPAFNPRRTVILETQPDPLPRPADTTGTVDLIERSTDELELTIDTPSPAIVLITDVYTNGWRARPLSPGPQKEYNLLRADYILRAIPVAAGKHHILVEYAPRAFRIGRMVSLVTLLLFLVAIAYCVRSHVRRRENPMPDKSKART